MRSDSIIGCKLIPEKTRRVGPVDKRPSPDMLHNFVKKKSYDMWDVTRAMWRMTHDPWHVTSDTWHVTGGGGETSLKISAP